MRRQRVGWIGEAHPEGEGDEEDEDVHEEYRTEEKTLLVDKSSVEGKITNIEKLIKDLKEGEMCPTCKRALDEVDHSSEIKEMRNY